LLGFNDRAWRGGTVCEDAAEVIVARISTSALRTASEAREDVSVDKKIDAAIALRSSRMRPRAATTDP
jgi:hypothetical protein